MGRHEKLGFIFSLTIAWSISRWVAGCGAPDESPPAYADNSSDWLLCGKPVSEQPSQAAMRPVAETWKFIPEMPQKVGIENHKKQAAFIINFTC